MNAALAPAFSVVLTLSVVGMAGFSFLPAPMNTGQIETRTDPLVGFWKVEFANGITQEYEIQNDQSVSVRSANPKWSSNGRLKLDGSEIKIAFHDDRLERWTIVGNRVIVEHWYPASAFSKVKPVLGIGEPVKTDRPSTVVGGVEFQYEMEAVKLKPGASVPHGNGIHEFVDVPADLLGRNFASRNGYLGIANFRVVEDQKIYLALYGGEWGVGGNPSGGWKEEVIPRAALEEQGWKEVAVLPVNEKNPEKPNPPSWIVFARDCKSGSVFAIRNHKYQAPIVIWGPKQK